MAPNAALIGSAEGSVQYGPLRTHAFVCNIHMGVMENPLYSIVKGLSKTQC